MSDRRPMLRNASLARLLAGFGLLNVAEWGFIAALSGELSVIHATTRPGRAVVTEPAVVVVLPADAVLAAARPQVEAG